MGQDAPAAVETGLGEAGDTISLSTEASNPASRELDQLGPLEIVSLMNREDGRVAPAVGLELPRIAQAVEVIAERLRRGGRLVYMGAGTSGRLGVLDAAECPPTFNTPPDQVISRLAGGLGALVKAAESAEDKAELGRADAAELGLRATDALVGLSASGRTPYVIGALRYAREVGAAAIAITCNSPSALSEIAEITIAPVTGPEVLAGSTRLKAGTAQKMVLNMLSTAVMVRLGKTYGNLMVDMRPTNAKLRRRAARIVAEATGQPEAVALAMLERSQGETRTAIVALLAGIEPSEARNRLARSGGFVREALTL